MRRNLQQFLLALLVAFAGTASAQVSSDFEPSGNGSLSVRDELIMNNWRLPDFDANVEGVTPISGTSSIGILSPGDNLSQTSGIVTPYMNFSNSETVSFNYKLHRIFPSSCRRWFMVWMVDHATDNDILIDSVEIPSSASVFNYSKEITGYAGTHLVYVNVKGEGCNSRFIMDDFTCTATDANITSPNFFIINGVLVGEDPNATTSLQHGNTSGVSLNNGAGNVNNITTLNTTNEVDGAVNESDAPSNGMVSQGNDVSLYPNPTMNNVNLQFYSDDNQQGQIEVYNISGTKLISVPANISMGSNIVNLDVANLNAGNYFVSLVTNQGITNKRFTRIQ